MKPKQEVEMSPIMRFRNGALAPLDWPDLSWFPLLAPTIRIEEHVDGDRYTLRAELPGIDPVKDMRLTCVGGELRIDVERKDSHVDKTRSEFHYGVLFRAIALPTGTRRETITATYADGILEITATVGEPGPTAKEIPIKVERGKKH